MFEKLSAKTFFSNIKIKRIFANIIFNSKILFLELNDVFRSTFLYEFQHL